MTMYFPLRPGNPTGGTGVGAAARAWTAQNPNWQFRQDMSRWPPSRRTSADEVAQALLADPTIRQVLAVLASPLGKAIVSEVASIWLPPVDAALLADALTIAWKVIRDQNRPAWQRADALIAVAVAAAALVVVAIAGLYLSS